MTNNKYTLKGPNTLFAYTHIFNLNYFPLLYYDAEDDVDRRRKHFHFGKAYDLNSSKISRIFLLNSSFVVNFMTYSSSCYKQTNILCDI